MAAKEKREIDTQNIRRNLNQIGCLVYTLESLSTEMCSTSYVPGCGLARFGSGGKSGRLRVGAWKTSCLFSLRMTQQSVFLLKREIVMSAECWIALIASRG